MKKLVEMSLSFQRLGAKAILIAVAMSFAGLVAVAEIVLLGSKPGETEVVRTMEQISPRDGKEKASPKKPDIPKQSTYYQTTPWGSI